MEFRPDPAPYVATITGSTAAHSFIDRADVEPVVFVGVPDPVEADAPHDVEAPTHVEAPAVERVTYAVAPRPRHRRSREGLDR